LIAVIRTLSMVPPPFGAMLSSVQPRVTVPLPVNVWVTVNVAAAVSSSVLLGLVPSSASSMSPPAMSLHSGRAVPPEHRGLVQRRVVPQAPRELL